MRFNQSIIHFLCFSVLTFLLTSPFLVGCGESVPETATVIELTQPKVLSPSDALHLTISTDFQTPLSEKTFSEILSIDSTDLEGIASNGLIYNTKKEFSITQDFNQTFQLDPDEPRISVELIKPGPSGSVRLTVLIDDEVEYEQSLTSRGSMSFYQSFSRENITF